MFSLNGRKPQLLVDPTVDLARERASMLPARWIMPLTEPLRKYGSEPDDGSQAAD
jgi:vitamin K-dependent gamma-carboxylase